MNIKQKEKEHSNFISEEEEDFLEDEKYIMLMVNSFKGFDDYSEPTDEDRILDKYGYQRLLTKINQH